MKIGHFHYHQYGAVTEEGRIEINLNLCTDPIKFIATVVHEFIHWVADEVRAPQLFHYHWDMLATYIFPYRRGTNRAGIRRTVRWSRNER